VLNIKVEAAPHDHLGRHRTMIGQAVVAFFVAAELRTTAMQSNVGLVQDAHAFAA
jgi:hypothetical protein